MSDIATKLTTIVENQQKVYNAGYGKGDGDGRTAGFNYGWEQGLQQGRVEGKQAEYDRFWDEYQQGGTRTDYTHGFAGVCWTTANFKPKYDIEPLRIGQMFFNTTELKIDLDKYFADLGVKFDTSKVTAAPEWLMNSGIMAVGIIDTTSSTTINYMFSGAKALHTIRLLKLKTDGTQLVNAQTFQNCTALENITVEGTIGKGGLDLHWSTLLSKASVISIINALSTTTSGLSITLSQTAVTNAFGSTTADEWTALIATKSNWTISLV